MEKVVIFKRAVEIKQQVLCRIVSSVLFHISEWQTSILLSFPKSLPSVLNYADLLANQGRLDLALYFASNAVSSYFDSKSSFDHASRAQVASDSPSDGAEHQLLQQLRVALG